MADICSDRSHSHRLAHMGIPVGAPSDDSVLRTVCKRPAEGDHGLADESSLQCRGRFRHVPGVLAEWLRHPQRMQLRQRGRGSSTMDLHTIRASGFSRFPDMGHLVRGSIRICLLGSLSLGLSACAHWTPSWMEKPVAQAPAPAAHVSYQQQPRLGAAWQYQQPEPGLVHILGKQMPAIVITPAHGPSIVHPRMAPAHPQWMPQKTIPFPTRKPAFHIPQAWFKAGARHVHTKVAIVNPWSCKPTKLPCGKAGTYYWACQKRNGTLAQIKGTSCKR